MPPEDDASTAAVLARLDQRTLTLERDVSDIRARMAGPPWPAVVAAVAAVAALAVNLIDKL